MCDTVSGCHGEIGDGSSPQVSARVQPEAEAESNLISETMTWLCARARSWATGKANTIHRTHSDHAPNAEVCLFEGLPKEASHSGPKTKKRMLAVG